MNPPPSLDDLKRLSRRDLQQRWQQFNRGKSPPGVKAMLLRDLAWYAQGDRLDVETQKLLKSAVKVSEINRLAAGSGAESRQPRKRLRKPSTHSKPQLQAGTKLVRTWRGKTFEVEVLEPGKRFNFRGQEYGSLTQIAEEITGAHWSGPRFFGLNRMKGIQ